MIGKTISHYKILEKIGSGGMGIVYKAQDLKLDRFVALKFLPPHLTTSEDEKQRFIHEAKAASSLDHNNICAIYEIDETEEGQLFISMACYEGETLDKRIKEKPLPIDEANDITIQIAQGLAKAHEKEIVHRDIKPANIMLTSDGVVKILDFGLAKLSTQTKLTKEGTTLGTIAYMSPEQTRGESVDHRSDIWSLGVILYEMITGQLPFKGDYDQAVMYGIANEQPEPITGLRTGVSLELERIVNRCISKDPQDRYQHADDLLSELNKLKKESELKTIPTKTLVSKNRFKSVFLLAAILSVVMVIILLYSLLPLSEKTSSGMDNSIAVLPFTDLSPDKNQEYFCDGMTEQIISNLSRIRRLKIISRTSVMKFKDTEKTAPEIGKELNVVYVLEGSIRKFGNRLRVTAQLINVGDDFHLWSQDYDKAYQNLFDVQDDVSKSIAEALLGKLSTGDIDQIKTERPEKIEIYDQYLRAKDLHHRFLGNLNPDYLHDASTILKEILDQQPDYLIANVELADVYNTYFNNLAKTDGEKNRYLEFQKKYIEIANRLNPNSMEMQYVKLLVSDAENEENWYSNNIEFLKKYPNHDRANWALGQSLFLYGLVHLSLPNVDRAYQLNPYGKWHCLTLARVYYYIGEYKKAETEFKKSLQIDPMDYWTLLRYTHYLISFKRTIEAEKLLSKWEEIKPNDIILECHRAYLYAIKGQKEKALSHFNQTISNTENSPSFPLAILYLLLNDQEKAIELIIEGEKDYSSRGISRSRYFRYLNFPYYKILHNDPRFQEILAKHKKLYEENLEKYGDIEL